MDIARALEKNFYKILLKVLNNRSDKLEDK